MKTAVRVRHHPIQRIKRKTRHLASSLGLYDRLEALKDALVDMSDNVKNKTSDAIAASVRSAKSQTTKVNRYITRRPYKMIGIASLAALLVGYFIHRE